MKPIFEAKYINVTWLDKNTPLNIQESMDTIPIDTLGKLNYKIDVITYSKITDKVPGQVAFRLLDDTVDVVPFFEVNELEKNELIPVVDNLTGKKWWIENGKWDSRKKFRDSPICRHAGEAILRIGHTRCVLQIGSSSFKYEDLQLYLDDFQNDFWYLILKEKSYVMGAARNQVEENNNNKILDPSATQIIDKFLEFATKISENPKKELREIQSLKDIKKVRPVPRTFMEIATKGYQKLLTSRDYKDSYNVAENKYVYYMLGKIFILLQRITQLTNRISNQQENKLKNYEERLSNFSTTKKINKEATENEIKELELILKEEPKLLLESITKQKEFYRNKQEVLNSLINDQENLLDGESLIVTLRPSKIEKHEGKLQFNGSAKQNLSDEWYKFPANSFYSFQFNILPYEDIIDRDLVYKITGNIIKSKKNINQYVIHERYFQHISKIELLPFIPGVKFVTVTVKLDRKQEYKGTLQFTGTQKLENGSWYTFSNNDYYSFEFDNAFFGESLKKNSIYKITGYIEKSKFFQEKSKKTKHIRKFLYVENIEIISSGTEEKLKLHKQKRDKLVESNWVRDLSTQEIKEQEFEKNAIKKSIELTEKQQELYESLAKDFTPLLAKINKIRKVFKAFKVEEDSYFPNSMTFVQNPNYQGSYKVYKEILNLSGIDEKIFLGLQEVDKIGIIDIPLIYERWVLLQIIKVLIDKFNFLPYENWKHNLMEQFLKVGKNIKIEFINESTKRHLVLWYEKEVYTYADKEAKYPDFILDVKSLYGNNGTSHRMVMDAKFYEDINAPHIGGQCRVVNELYSKKEEYYMKYKNYSEDGKNTVFIIHPSTTAIKSVTTSSDWGQYSYYGENSQCNWDKDENDKSILPDHKYGAILLSPMIRNGTFLDDLQRLIGMHLQYGIEDNSNISDDGRLDSITRGKVFCLVCGSDSCKITPANNRNGVRYFIECQDCHHTTRYNYCWNCKHRLIKHGEYWSYHTAQALEPFNIKCPACGEIL